MPTILTSHDLSILEKIKDPEAGPSAPLHISSELPKDPHVADPIKYQEATQKERALITSLQSAEMQLAGLKETQEKSPLEQYLTCVKLMDDLIKKYPNYASARNNRAQALRRIFGDGLLVRSVSTTPVDAPDASFLDRKPLSWESSESALLHAATTILRDLSTAIKLLSPKTPFAPISAQAAKTLAQAYTQRGAIYHLTAKKLSLTESKLQVEPDLKESQWSKLDFEKNASKDFMLGARYGNEVAKALAVSTNPTAKLCGEMVKEAMRKEYAGEAS